MESGPPRKRQKFLVEDEPREEDADEHLPTPPASDSDAENAESRMLKRATKVLATASAALVHLTQLYDNDSSVRQTFTMAVDAVVDAHHSGRKLIVCGVGKSAFIGMKLAATCRSLGVGASFMHACEAAHGDLGDVRAGDVLLFVSFSGKTPELVNLLPHLPQSTAVIVLSSQTKAADCPLLAGRGDNGLLLPAPIPESEEATFGVSAPTTSTTVALAVADMLALSVAEKIHQENKQSVFKRNHPGGAIGMDHQEVKKLKKDGMQVSILELPSPSISAEDSC